MAARRSLPKKKSRPAASRRRLKPATESRGLNREDIALLLTHEPLQPLLGRIVDAGGVVLGSYRDPFGGRELVLAALPFRSVQPTPFQRDLSPTHTKRLAHSIEEAGSFLDPLIVVPGARRRLPDSEWPAPARSRQGAGAKVHHRIDLSGRGARLPYLGAEHRESAQPQGSQPRSDSHGARPRTPPPRGQGVELRLAVRVRASF